MVAKTFLQEIAVTATASLTPSACVVAPCDANGNGVCDDAEIPGCTDSAACNYDAMASKRRIAISLTARHRIPMTIESFPYPGWIDDLPHYVNMLTPTDRGCRVATSTRTWWSML